MANLPNLIVSAVAEWNGKALTKGTTQISKFNKTVMGLGRTLGVTFSAAALLGYSKKAVAAYGEQIAEAKRSIPRYVISALILLPLRLRAI